MEESAMSNCRRRFPIETKKRVLHSGFLPDGSSPHWSEITASCLLGLNEDGEIVEEGSLGGGPETSADFIHRGVRKVRPDAEACTVKVNEEE
jgi:ribulose-5-phosphate 4-epimerase/fuculose-1-phosphate aldolase